MNLYIPSNYFKLVGNPRWKRSLFESVSVITQFQCSIRSHFRPLSTPPFNRSHRRPRKAWNSLNVSVDWKSNAVSRGRYEHEGGLSLGEHYCREPLSAPIEQLFTSFHGRERADAFVPFCSTSSSRLDREFSPPSIFARKISSIRFFPLPPLSSFLILTTFFYAV